jgi:hypothetical protein
MSFTVLDLIILAFTVINSLTSSLLYNPFILNLPNIKIILTPIIRASFFSTRTYVRASELPGPSVDFIIKTNILNPDNFPQIILSLNITFNIFFILIN